MVYLFDGSYYYFGQRVWVVLLDYSSLENRNSPVANWFETQAKSIANHYFSRSIVVTGYEIQ